LPDQNGRARWREKFGGNMEATLEVIEERPPQRLVRKIVGDDLPFGGQWEYEIKPLTARSQITVTERGFVRNPIFRFMSRFVFGHHATIEKYLRSLAAKFAAPAQISEWQEGINDVQRNLAARDGSTEWTGTARRRLAQYALASGG